MALDIKHGRFIIGDAALQPPIVTTIGAVTPQNIAYPDYLVPVTDSSFGYDMEIIRISGPEWASSDTEYSHGYSKNQRWNSNKISLGSLL